ncbi:MAG: TatD family hydrolase, partial [Gammaproteobacteria bacterium]
MTAFVNVAVDPEAAASTLELAEAHEDVYASVGIHPHSAGAWAGRLDEAMTRLERLAAHPKV